MTVARLVFALMLTGCALPALGQQGPRVRQVGRSACTTPTHTEGATPSGAASGCRAELSHADGTWEAAYALHMCGPCAFTYDAATTTAERARGQTDACCYQAESPPPPPPPPPS